MNLPDFKVVVRCSTFNHSKYIVDTMNGFVMQETEFPYVCCIIDDASKDGEQGIILQYLEENFIDLECPDFYESYSDEAAIKFARHKTNENCYFSVVLLYENHYSSDRTTKHFLWPWRHISTYEAMCEGDDYWIDKTKLQYQVDFMQGHDECTLTYHSCKNIYVENFSGPKFPCGQKVKEEYSIKELLSGYYFQTATIMIRTDLLYNPLVNNIYSIIDYDFVLYFCAAMNGKVQGIDRQMSVYRRTGNGISMALHNGEKDYYMIQKWYQICKLLPFKISRIVHYNRILIYIRGLYYHSKKLFVKAMMREFFHFPGVCCLVGYKIFKSFIRNLRNDFK